MTDANTTFAQLAAEIGQAGHVSLAARLAGAVQVMRDHLTHLVADLLAAPAEARQLFAGLSKSLMTGEGVRAVTYVLILFMVGAGVEWLYRTYAAGSLLALEASFPATPLAALRFGAKRFFLNAIALVLFGLSIVAVSLGFVWPPGVEDVVLTATLAIVLVRFFAALVDLVVGARAPALRLLAVGGRTAMVVEASLVLVSAILVAGWLAPDLLLRVFEAPHLAAAVRFVAGTAAMLASLAAVLVWRHQAMKRRALPSMRPEFPLAFLIAASILAIYLAWLAGADRLAGSLSLVAAVVACESLLRQIVEAFWPAREATGAANDPLPLLPGVVLRLARFLVAGAGLTACAYLWDLPILPMAGNDSFGGRLATRLFGVVGLVLAADLAWAAAKGAIDSRTRGISAFEADGEPGPNARLLTLLPLTRKAVAIGLSGLLILSCLSVLGIEIAPLLAGAGVIGIAIGFGAQTLVRDVIAGVFFLVEDVFRVGEYIESGSSTKGTVERITLRTVALRHHNGPLHFVPYGALGAVRNNSRDWVVEKFNLPLPIDTDSETIRKLVKKVGQTMMDDAELGPYILAPLKTNLYRIEPGVKIFRCKVQTPPGKQFDIRAAAYKRIEAALRESGLRFAEIVPKVLVEHATMPAHNARPA
jgi:small-conductance mechanosensitive channel